MNFLPAQGISLAETIPEAQKNTPLMRPQGCAVNKSPSIGHPLTLKRTMSFLQTDDLNLRMSSKIKLQLLKEKIGQRAAIPREDMQSLLLPVLLALHWQVRTLRVMYNALIQIYSHLARLSPLDGASK